MFHLDPATIGALLVACLVAYALARSFWLPLRWVALGCLNLGSALAVLYGLQYVLPAHLHVGLNVWNMATMALLGVPGAGALLAVSALAP